MLLPILELVVQLLETDKLVYIQKVKKKARTNYDNYKILNMFRKAFIPTKQYLTSELPYFPGVQPGLAAVAAGGAKWPPTGQDSVSKSISIKAGAGEHSPAERNQRRWLGHRMGLTPGSLSGQNTNFF